MTTPSVPPSPAHLADLAKKLRSDATWQTNPSGFRTRLLEAAAALDALSPAPPAEPEQTDWAAFAADWNDPEAMQRRLDQFASPAPPSPEPPPTLPNREALRADVRSIVAASMECDENDPRLTRTAHMVVSLVPSGAGASGEAERLLGEVVDWLGVPDWSGPQLPNDLARRIAAALRPRPEEADPHGT